MKSVSEMRHLEQFGIKPLTGEADALGFRILCDLDLQGVQVFKECFGMPCISIEYAGRQITPDNGLAKNWNSGSIASVMLTGHDVVPLAIMGFYLQGKTVILATIKHTTNGSFDVVYALDAMEDVVLDQSGNFYNFVDYLHDKEDPSPWPDCYGEIRRIIRQRKSDSRVVGTRNVHQMSGRVS